MKRLASSRAPAAILALAAPAAALAADTGSAISPTGWASLFAVPVVVGILWVVHKKIG
jgi:hypothetical protein